MRLNGQHRFLLRVMAVVAVMVAAKFGVRALGWELVSVNPMFTGVVAANIFLMGFLLSGVLADYKESEKLPGELAACLENMTQEIVGMGLGNGKADVSACLRSVDRIGRRIHEWFYRKADMAAVIESLNDLTVELGAVEGNAQVSYITRVKQEQTNLRRTIVRIETIRDTSFVSSGYLLADLVTAVMCVGLILMSMDPFYEAVIITAAIAFLLVFLRSLIRDLDNPFGYYERASAADVSLAPFLGALHRIEAIAAESRRASKARRKASRAAERAAAERATDPRRPASVDERSSQPRSIQPSPMAESMS